MGMEAEIAPEDEAHADLRAAFDHTVIWQGIEEIEPEVPHANLDSVFSLEFL
jgi:hypothetical protein